MVNLDEDEIKVLLYALKSLDEDSEYYMSSHYTSPSWVKEKLQNVLKDLK